jgi:hypothetical protein
MLWRSGWPSCAEHCCQAYQTALTGCSRSLQQFDDFPANGRVFHT